MFQRFWIPQDYRFAPKFFMLSLFVLGGTLTAYQTLIFRKFLSLFGGSEFNLGILFAGWLLSGAFGVYLGYRLRRFFCQSEFFILQFIFGLCIFLCGILSFFIPYISGNTIGESGNLFQLILAAGFIVFPVTIFAGFLFSLSLSVSLFADGHSRITLLYASEALGSALLGFLLVFLIIDKTSFLELIFLLTLLHSGLFSVVFLKKRVKTVCLAVFFLLGTIGFFHIKSLEWFLMKLSYKGYEIDFFKESRYGQILHLRRHNQEIFLANNVIVSIKPNNFLAAEIVHPAFLAHSDPKRVLFVGIPDPAVIREMLKYPITTLDVVAIDAVLVRKLTENVVYPAYVNMHIQDPRVFLARSGAPYDLILLSVPTPDNLQANRFFSIEFYRLIATRLCADGIFSYSVSGGENFISFQKQVLLQTMYNSLKKIFPTVTYMPGEIIHFFSGKNQELSLLHYDLFVRRLHERKIQASDFNEYFLFDRFSRFRQDFLTEKLEQKITSQPLINSDFSPNIYLFGSVLNLLEKSGIRYPLQFILEYNVIRSFLLFSVFVVLCVAVFLRIGHRIQSMRFFAIFLMGFVMMGVQVFLLFCFQVSFGSLFHYLGFLLVSFLSGLAGGGILARTLTVYSLICRKTIALFLVMLLFSFFLLCGHSVFFFNFSQLPVWLFLIFSFSSGIIGGSFFIVSVPVIATQDIIQPANSSLLYAADLFGASFGALFFATVVVPFFGLQGAMGILLVLSVGILLTS